MESHNFIVHESNRFVTANDGGINYSLPGGSLMPDPLGQDVYFHETRFDQMYTPGTGILSRIRPDVL